MNRRLLNLGTAVSLLFCAASAAMWVRSYFASDVWASHRYTPSSASVDSRSVEATGGWLFLVRSTMLLPPGAVPQLPHDLDTPWSHEPGPPNTGSGLASGAKGSLLAWQRVYAAPQPAAPRAIRVGDLTVAGVRLLPVMILTALPPALWTWLRLRARRAAKPGCCAKCGYDLRATRGRCPECGTTP